MPSHKRLHSRSEAKLDQPAIVKRPKRTLKPKEKSLVERINALSVAQFYDQFFPPSVAGTVGSPTNLHITLSTWKEMSSPFREACVDLLKLTSRDHYHSSEKGWSRAKKLKEMGHPAMKYLLLRPVPAAPPTVKEGKLAGPEQTEGFLSFMITEEDRSEVIYCYELHLQPSLQGKGVGRRMMEVMEMIGSRVGVEKAMLTVFRSNDRAVEAYERWGYRVDDFSPEPRKLRDGTVKEPSYVILSKGREGFAREERAHEQNDPGGLSKSADENVTDNKTASAQHG
ncbi:hypothetical protein EPUS_06937 [Endocarpon pusillum Z07020]|uniref:N-alpha-acetyltransferase 40 n=1 Tax=Endocarpon pusillum (strain Z07020 / HMAS-L-300199) TaxID=1263415 RepID=U1G8Y9_ENDPU|nr:uncharacterized protein EPUS_06937 [Endocarpon pusillum Z07020]ERF68126.1 hypothetical protein EPUS_06937 [Endocarpon pusillum Z07020]